MVSRVMDPHSAPTRSRPALFGTFVRTVLFVAIPALLFAAWPARELPAQTTIRGARTIPSDLYFNHLEVFYAGEFVDAGKLFQSDLRSGIKTVDTRWIDAICYYAMMGECHYQLGEYALALDEYAAALQHYVRFSDWLSRVHSASTIQSGGALAAAVTPWGASGSTALVAVLPRKMHILQGQLNINPQIESGQAFQQAVNYPLNPQEIIRCTALAIRRRREIMGPACEHSQLSKDLVNVFSVRIGQPNPWSDAWLNLLLGLSYASTGRAAQAAQTLEESLVINGAAGQFVHPLTCVAQVELGRLAMEAHDLDKAAGWFAEASFAAAVYEDIGVIDEAIRLGSDVHLAARPAVPYPPLDGAAAWALRNRYRHLQATAFLCAAENYAELGQPRIAESLLAKAAASMTRNNLSIGPLGARFQYVTALVALLQDRPVPARTALAAALSRQAKVSPWWNHLMLVDGLYAGGQITPRQALPLYESLLGDPTPWDWRLRPLDSLTMLMSSKQGALQNWFEVSLDRRNESSFQVADQIRRHRFFGSLPLGGRLEALRWTIAAPDEVLSDDVRLRRQDLLARFTALDEATTRANEAARELLPLPLIPTDEADRARQANLLSRLAEASGTQEAILAKIALLREPCELAFPPAKPLSDVQEELQDGQAILLFQGIGNRLLGFLITKERYTSWDVDAPVQLRREVTDFLRELGHFDGNRDITADVLLSEAWKNSGATILEHLLRGSDVDLSQGISELVVVPDGELWYLPFEALCQRKGEGFETLIERFPIRYAPTLGLAVPDGRARKRVPNLLVTLGKLYPRDKSDAAQHAFEALQARVPVATATRTPLPQPLSEWASFVDRLLVLDDLVGAANSSANSLRLIHDGARVYSTLEDWQPLPWGAPELTILPGFHTAAEHGLKRKPANGVGDDIFLPLCGLMAAGGRSAVISRWRVGGKSTTDLMTEFLVKSTSEPLAEAWRSALLSQRDQALSMDQEPRVRRSARNPVTTAQHPFFWAGYLLADPGEPRPAALDEEPLALPPKVNIPTAENEAGDDPDGIEGDLDNSAPGAADLEDLEGKELEVPDQPLPQ